MRREMDLEPEIGIELQRHAGKVKAVYVDNVAYRIEPGSLTFRNGFVSWTSAADSAERITFRTLSVAGFIRTT